MTELAMFEKFTSGGVEHRKSFWTTNKRQCLTEVCKTVNLCRLHSFAETSKTNWFSRGPNEFGGGNVASDTFVNGCPAVKSASGAGAQEQVRWEMGLRVERTGGGSSDGCQGSIATFGEGASLKLSRWGVAWK